MAPESADFHRQQSEPSDQEQHFTDSSDDQQQGPRDGVRPAPAVSAMRLFVDHHMAEVEGIDFGCGRAAVLSRRGPHKSSPNEDAAALLPFDENSGVLVVADGMGGAAAGETASRLALEALRQSIQHGAERGDLLRSAILNGFEAANEAVCSHGVGAATTLAVVELQGAAARPYHVGDSMILVVGQRGKIKLQTSAHSPVGFAIQAGLLDEEEAMHHEERHVVSNVIGEAEMRIELGPTIHLAPRDTLLIASDGLSDNLHTDEIVQHIRTGPLLASAHRLAETATKRMLEPAENHPSKPDDLTFVVWRRV